MQLQPHNLQYIQHAAEHPFLKRPWLNAPSCGVCASSCGFRICQDELGLWAGVSSILAPWDTTLYHQLPSVPPPGHSGPRPNAAVRSLVLIDRHCMHYYIDMMRGIAQSQGARHCCRSATLRGILRRGLVNGVNRVNAHPSRNMYLETMFV